jgi:hypothetical protein
MVHDWAAQRSCTARWSLRITLPLAAACSRLIGLVEDVEMDGKAWLNRREVRQWVFVSRAAVALTGCSKRAIARPNNCCSSAWLRPLLGCMRDWSRYLPTNARSQPEPVEMG